MDNKQDITKILQNRNKLKDLSEEVVSFYHNRISELKVRKLSLEQEVSSIQQRKDNYDRINQYKRGFH